MATIRDVAAKAGVSAATVSRILSNDNTFSASEETRRLVYQAVEDLSYMPYIRGNKQSAQKKSTGSLTKAGCIIAPNSGRRHVLLTYEHQLRELKRSLAEHEIELSFITTEHEVKGSQELEALAAENPAALVFMCNPQQDFYRRLREIAPYAVGISCRMTDIDNVTYDKEQTAQTGVSLLARRGHQKIAFIGGPGIPGDGVETSRRFHGFELGMRRHGLAVNPDYVRNCEWNVEKCYQQTQAILRLPDPPDAIVCVSDNMVFSIYRAIYEAGLQIPKDIAVFSCKAAPSAEFVTPAVATSNVPIREIADAAVALLERRMRGEDFPIVNLMLRAAIAVNESM